MKKDNMQLHTKQRRRSLISTFYHKNKVWFIVAIIFLLINSVLEILLAYFLQAILDQGISGSVSGLLELAVQSAVLFVAITGTWLVVRSSKNRFVKNAMRNYKETIFEKITRKSISSFVGETTGRYISGLTNDATSIEQNYLLSIFKFTTNIIWFFGALALMLWYDWSMTLIVIGLSLLPITISIAFGSRLVKEERAISEKNETFVGMIKDLLTGFTVIKSFKAEKEITKLFNEHNSNLEENKTKRRLTEEMIQIVSGSAGFIVQFGIFFYGTYLAITGDSITVGIVIAFVQLMNFVLMPVRELPALFSNRKAAIGLIDKVADAVEINASRPGKTINSILDDCIAIENLSFGYEDNIMVLKDINLKFDAGKSYAIVGGSAAEKQRF